MIPTSDGNVLPTGTRRANKKLGGIPADEDSG